jgi:DNA-binding NtrC family response regulator
MLRLVVIGLYTALCLTANTALAGPAAEALRDGAFTVLDDPVPIESMLQALERVVRRHYRDHWPAA